MKKKIAVFDFDGTLTRSDTLPAFIRHACGLRRLLWALALLSPRLVLMKLHLADNGRTKERLFAHCFGGMPLERFNALCRDFARHNAGIVRPGGRRALAEALAEGAQVYIVSASLDNWVAPFFLTDDGGALPPRLTVLGTRPQVDGPRLTGRFATPNCYGAEKVRRLTEAIPALAGHRTDYFITAYGDSRGDKEMLDYADEPHWKPFRKQP